MLFADIMRTRTAKTTPLGCVEMRRIGARAMDLRGCLEEAAVPQLAAVQPGQMLLRII